MRKHQFVVIGLGAFGQTVATELSRLGNDVLGVDHNERKVDTLADSITHAVVADASDERALRELSLKDYDAAVVAIGEDIEASVLATLNLKSIGVKEVWVKAITAQHHRILAKIGATRIIHPEYEIGQRVAQALNYPIVNNYMDVGDDEYLVEIVASEKITGRHIGDVISESGAAVRALLVRRGRENYFAPDTNPETVVIAEGDHIVLLGQRAALKKIARHL